MEEKHIFDLGKLTAEVKSVSDSIDEMKQVDKEHREYVKSKLAILDDLNRDFKAAEPIIKDINKWKERTIGAVMFISVISGALSFFVADIIHYFKVKLGM